MLLYFVVGSMIDFVVASDLTISPGAASGIVSTGSPNAGGRLCVVFLGVGGDDQHGDEQHGNDRMI